MRHGPQQDSSKYSKLLRFWSMVSEYLVLSIKRWGDFKDVLSPSQVQVPGTELAQRTDQRISSLTETVSHSAVTS